MTVVTEKTKLTQYRMTVKNHARIAAAAKDEGVTIIEWMAAHFELYWAEVDAIEEKRNGALRPLNTPLPSTATVPPRKRQGVRSTAQR